MVRCRVCVCVCMQFSWNGTRPMSYVCNANTFFEPFRQKKRSHFFCHVKLEGVNENKTRAQRVIKHSIANISEKSVFCFYFFPCKKKYWNVYI